MRKLFLVLLATALGALPGGAAPVWQAIPGAPVTGRIDDLHFLDGNTGWVCTSWGDIHHTADGGASWTLQHSDGVLYFRCIRFADVQRGWAGTLVSDSLLFRTTNGGDDWTVVPGIPAPRPNAICGLSVASGQVIYAAGSYSGPARMLRTTDGGATWTAKDLAPLATTLVDVQFRSPSEGFAVGSIGVFPDESRAVVLHTTDGGETWQQRFVGTRLGEWGWKISFPTPTVGYVSLERFAGPMYFLKTVDGGMTWAELPFEDYNEQGIGFATADIGWIGGRGNPTFGTTDGGATWLPTPWGAKVNRFQFLSPTFGFAAGVTVYRYSDPSVAVGDAPRPSRRSLAAPNPFVANTTIRFTLRAAGGVHLFVADPSGRIVRTIEKGGRDAGPHVVEWDGRDDRGEPAPAGIYLYVLHSGEQHEMGKLVRVR